MIAGLLGVVELPDCLSHPWNPDCSHRLGQHSGFGKYQAKWSPLRPKNQKVVGSFIILL